MKILVMIFCSSFLLTFLFARIEVDGRTNITIAERALTSLIVGVILTVILFLPVLGLAKLLGY